MTDNDPYPDRILVIDDNRGIHGDFRKILGVDRIDNAALAEKEAVLFGVEVRAPRQRRVEIQSAYQGQEGLTLVQQALQEGRPHAMAFVDVRMPPGWDGIETAIKIWEVAPDLQVVICTAYADYSWEVMSERLGSSDRWVILKKPFDPVEVLQLVNALTEKVRLMHQARAKQEELERRVRERTAELAVANETLRESEERLNAVGTMANVGGWEFDVAVLDVHWTRETYRIHDVPEGTKIDLSQAILFFDMPGRASLEAAQQRAMETGAPYDLELPFTSAKGRHLWTHTMGRAVMVNGTVVRLTGTFQDITHRRQAEEREERMETQLRREQKLAVIGTLARGMAHEINNPIMGVLNYAQLIKDNAADNAALVEFADEIIAEIQRVANMTHSLLSFAQQQDAQPFATTTGADVMAVVLPLAEQAARERGILLSSDIPPDLPSVSCHQGQLGQVVMALLTNAMEAFDEGPLDPASPEAMQGKRLGGGDKKIVVSAEEVVISEQSSVNSHQLSVGPASDARVFRQSESFVASFVGNFVDKAHDKGTDHRSLITDHSSSCRWLRLTVEDNGPGIPATIRERVFDPFFTTKDRTKHSGLGLWISRSIAQEHGGTLSVESEVGQWTRFHVDLPVEEGTET